LVIENEHARRSLIQQLDHIEEIEGFLPEERPTIPLDCLQQAERSQELGRMLKEQGQIYTELGHVLKKCANP
jgi:hypothetical protein